MDAKNIYRIWEFDKIDTNRNKYVSLTTADMYSVLQFHVQFITDYS